VKESNAEPPPQELVCSVVEAVIFAAAEPVSLRELSEALVGTEPEEIEKAIDELSERYRAGGAGLQVERVAGGFRLATRPEVGAWVRRFFRQRNRTRLSQASLETLAIVAYRQPVTAPEVQAIRGVDSSASLRSLFDRKLIRVLGKKKVVGSPLLYGTSKHFLEHFGLDRLQDLPPVDSFSDLLGGEADGLGPISAPVAARLGDPPVSGIVESEDGPELALEEE
jgi:segregation and condensation protein B